MTNPEATMSKYRALLTLAAVLAGCLALQAQSPARPAQGPPGTVTLPLAEYDRLLERAEHPPRVPEPPPIAAVLARGDLQVRVSGDRVRGTFSLDGEVFRTGITAVPLVAGATLIDARLERDPLPLMHDGTTSVALIEGPRPFSIELQWGDSLASAPGRASFTLPVPAAGSVRAVIELPGQPADVRLEPGAITRTSAAGAATRIEATLVPGSRTRVSWSSRQVAPASGARELRLQADIKTLVSVGEADLRLTSLVDATIVRGETERLELRVPAGFTVVSASGSGLERTDESPGTLGLVLRRPGDRRHQVLVSFERSGAGTGRLETVLPSLTGAERETGEVAIEAVGTMELTAAETDLLRRIDVREAGAPLRSLAREPLLAALRYHRRGQDPLTLAMDVTRFPDAPVVAAVAERAVATTLVTAEGRALTEIALTMRNRAQPFMRVELPPGATVVSAEVEGQAAKLAQGSDGARVPLLRPGFRPDGAYTVSFVYVHNGQAFGKKGRAELQLPRMDVPVALMEWEMFVPDRYRVRRFEGNAMPVAAVATPVFRTASVGGAPGAVAETVGRAEEKERDTRDDHAQAPSQNVFSLQRRVAGVLPVRVDVPRAGLAYHFARPLVLDEMTQVSFEYRAR